MNPNLLYDTVHRILRTARGPRYRHKATFVSVAGSVAAFAVVERWSSEDYVGSFCMDMTLQVATTVKEYRDVIYSHRDNLKCVLQKIQVDPTSGADVIGGKTFTSTHRCFLLDNSDATLPRGNPMSSGTFVDGKDDMRFFHVQLVDPVAEYMAMRHGGGVFRYTNNEDVVKSLILSQAKGEKGTQDIFLKGLDMVPTVTKDELVENLVIPHNTLLTDVPGWLQEKETGLYDKGLGSFIKNGLWYIFPLWRTNHLKTAKKKLVVIQVPTTLVPLADNTVWVDGNTVYVVCTGEARIQDLSVAGGLEGGNGVRFLRADAMTSNPMVSKEGTGEFNRSQYMAEFKVSEREDGFNIANMSAAKATNNVAFEMSKMYRNQGQLMTTTWQNSNSELVFPGMPVEVYHDVGGKISTYAGTLIQIDEQWALERPGLTDQVQTSVAGLVMFLSKNSTS